MRRLAVIDPNFVRSLEKQEDTLVYASPKQRGGEPYLSVYSQHGPGEDPDEGYFWARRGGKDSVAFVLQDRNASASIGVLRCYHAPSHGYHLKAFTGSIDKPEHFAHLASMPRLRVAYKDMSKYERGIVRHVLDEVIEEAGYSVTPASLVPVGAYQVSHNTDEESYLFGVEVDSTANPQPKYENEFEENTETVWLEPGEVQTAVRDWRANVLAYALSQ